MSRSRYRPGADEVGGHVPVAEAEPGRLRAVRGQLLLDAPGLVRPSPAPLRIGPAAQRVHDRVQVWTDEEPVELQVVRGVDHDGEVGAGLGLQAEREPGPTDAAGQGDDAHSSA